MTIDLNTLATVFAFIGCAALLVIWLTLGKRTLSNFYIMCTGIAGIVACARSDRHPVTMIGILIATAAVSLLLVVAFTLIKARRAARRQQLMVYRPKPAGKASQN